MGKKVVVIGGGIAGLSAGIYARKCGFDVTVLESRDIAGGNCTSWKRGDYVFEGGMHWLTGTNENEPMNKLWRHVGALGDGVNIRYNEPYMEYDYKGTPIRLYRDVDATERHLLDLSPTDAKEIKNFCNNIRRVRNLNMPVTDLPGLKVTKRNRPPLSVVSSYFSLVRMSLVHSGISRKQYANRFFHEGIRELILSFPNDRQGISVMFLTLGILARGDGGFPEGGSLPFVERIVKTLTMSGGELLCGTRAEKVLVENGKATGVIAGGRHIPADAVIVAADTMAIDNLFDIPLKASWLDEMRGITGPMMASFVSLGINADLGKYPQGPILKLRQPIKIADWVYEYLNVNNYAGDPTYSPEGKTAMTIALTGDTYAFWKKAKEENRYESEKQRIADEVIAAIAERMPEIRGQTEVLDVATPLTYERQCGNWKGSWMTEVTPAMKYKKYPAVIDGLSGVYFASHRMMPPGGLPPALMSGRTAVQYLCRDTGTVFVSEE